MTDKDKYLNNKQNQDADDEEGGSSTGTGGQSGSIQFHDFIGTTGLREDNLPPDELRRLRAVHNTAHEARVKKQKELREYRNDIKEGKVSLEKHRENMSAEMSSHYPPHPILSDKAQFSGVDKQENQVPSLNETQTNDADRNELEMEYRKKFQPELGPKFHPKPQYR